MEGAEGSRHAGVPCLSFVYFLEEESCGTEARQDLISCRSPPYLGPVSCILGTVRNACDCAGWQGPCLTPCRHRGTFDEERCNRDILVSGLPPRAIWPRSAIRALRWLCSEIASGARLIQIPKASRYRTQGGADGWIQLLTVQLGQCQHTHVTTQYTLDGKAYTKSLCLQKKNCI